MRALVDIRPEERRNTLAAFVTLLAITAGHTLLETARDTFFLTKLPASRLPVMYLAIVVVALALSQIPAARASNKATVAVSLVVAAVITTGFWALLGAGAASDRVLYALYVWTGVFGSWAMVQVWTLLGRAHTMIQAKRLYGLIGAGAVLGGVLGAVLARIAITALSPRATVLVASAIFAVSALPCSLLHVPRTDGEGAMHARRRARARRSPRRPLLASVELLHGNRFARRVLGIVLLSTITVTLADFLFKSQIAHAISDPRKLGAWLSTFYAVTNGLAVVMQLLVAPFLFRRAGVLRALFFFPTSLLLAATGLVLSGGALAAAVILKGLDGALRHSVHRTSTELLLVAVPDGVRERIKPLIDLVGARGGQAVASLMILSLVALGTTTPVVLGALILALAALWLVAAATLRQSYIEVFRDALKTGGLSGRAELPALDLVALETLFAGLNSDLDSEVIPSLELLAEQRRDRLIPALILHHPSRNVVLRALEIFAEMGRTDFVKIADRLNGHADRDVAAAALRARIAVQPDQALLVTRLGDACPQVAVTALVALMARGWIDLEDANKRLDAVLAGNSWPTIIEVARAVRIIGATHAKNDACGDRFDQLLVEIEGRLPDVQVRLEVARAMEARKSPRFVPLLVEMLRHHALRSAARSALLAIPAALELLDQALLNPEVPRDARMHIPRTVALFEPSAAADVLLRHLRHDAHESAVRFKVIRWLVKLRRKSPGLTLDAATLARCAEQTLDRVDELQRWGAALSTLSAGDEPAGVAHSLLVDLVRDKQVHATERVFLLLELSHGNAFDDVWRGLRATDPRSRASSLELLENLVKPPLRERVLALVHDDPRRSAAAVPYGVAVREILTRGGGTIHSLAKVRADELAALGGARA